MLQFTGWREPISISGAGKVVDGILRRRPCFLPSPCTRSGRTSQAGDLPLPVTFAECASQGGPHMRAESIRTPDVVGLTKVAPFSRRGFMTATAAVTAGYTLAAGPVRADIIKTDTSGLAVGDAKIKVADG